MINFREFPHCSRIHGIVRSFTSYLQTMLIPSTGKKVALNFVGVERKARRYCWCVITTLNLSCGWWCCAMWRWDVCGALKRKREGWKLSENQQSSHLVFYFWVVLQVSWNLPSIINLRLHSTVTRNLLSPWYNFPSRLLHRNAKQVFAECNQKELSSDSSPRPRNYYLHPLLCTIKVYRLKNLWCKFFGWSFSLFLREMTGRNVESAESGRRTKDEKLKQWNFIKNQVFLWPASWWSRQHFRSTRPLVPAWKFSHFHYHCRVLNLWHHRCVQHEKL